MRHDGIRAAKPHVDGGSGYFVAIEGEDSLVFHDVETREGVVVVDDAVAYVNRETWDRAKPDDVVVVFVGGEPLFAPVQLQVRKRRLRLLDSKEID